MGSSEDSTLSRSAFRTLIVILLVLISRPALAQQDSSIPDSSLEIAGQIRRSDGGKSLENIIIRLERFGGGLVDQRTTDSMGRFRFANLRPGQYIVSVYAPGFSAEPQQVEIYRQLIRRGQVFLLLKPDKLTATSKPSASSKLFDARVPSGAQKEYQKGVSALQEKKTEKAISHLEKAISLYPNFYEPQFLLGTTYMDVQQWSAAESALRRALGINPKAIDALVYLGEVYRRQKKYPEAEKTLQEALKLDDKVWQGHFTLGRVYWELGDITRAGRHAGRTLQLNSDLAEAHMLAGNIFMRAGRPENALTEYREYLRLAPSGDFVGQVRQLVQKLEKSLAVKK
jgi:tetratricopeptide (TPR) repeat protein